MNADRSSKREVVALAVGKAIINPVDARGDGINSGGKDLSGDNTHWGTRPF